MTTGKVFYDRDAHFWRIDAPPHVTLRMKRVFGKLSSRSHGQMVVSDTDENARDLEWFLSRYPMHLDPSSRQYLEQRSGQFRERASIVDAMLSRVAPPREFELALPPREYQKFAASLLLASGGLLLADDVGVGKTCSAICCLVDKRACPALVVTLTHLPKQWEREIHRFAPKLRTHVLKSAKPYDLTRLDARGRRNQEMLPGAVPDVIITSYSKLSEWSDILAPIIAGHAVVFDEVQELRNAGGGGRPVPAKYSAARHLTEHAGFVLGMSATPIHNYGDEFHAVLDIIKPNVLGTRSEFVREWCGDSYTSGGRISDPVAFGTYMRESGLMLRRTRRDVGRELPPVTRVPHQIEADTKALDAVSDACAELARTILKQGESERGEKLHASEEFTNRLRQATGIAKAPFVAEFVRMLVESGESVLLYAWHREVYSILQEKLAEFNPVFYTGAESDAQKEASKQAFVDGKSKILIMSLRAGAGLDGLQHVCRTVVYGELDWSPAVHEQATGRVARDGQKDPVVAYFLVSDHGADPVILDVLGVKKAQLDGVRQVEPELVEKLETDGGRVRKLAEHYLAARTRKDEEVA